jgi:hypothetical protein
MLFESIDSVDDCPDAALHGARQGRSPRAIVACYALYLNFASQHDIGCKLLSSDRDAHQPARWWAIALPTALLAPLGIHGGVFVELLISAFERGGKRPA